MPASYNRGYLPEIDHLRAFAALLVLFYHGLQLIGAQLAHGAPFDPTKHWLYPSNPLVAVIEEGHSAVGLFIVLSGFILSLGAIGNTVHYKRFLIARLLRIYPLLLVCLVLASPSYLTSLLTFRLPTTASVGSGSAFTSMFWAVAVEFQCYLIFPFLIAFSNERGSQFLVQLVAVGIILRVLAIAVGEVGPRDISYWTVVGRIDQFCIGIVAARLYVHRNLSQLHAGWFVLAAAAVVLILYAFNGAGGWLSNHAWKAVWPTVEGLMWACFIVTYVSAGRLMPSVLSRLAATLGEISYSIYLMHMAILTLIIKNALYLRPTGNGYYDALVTTLAVALPAIVVVSVLTYRTIELPFLRRRPKYVTYDDGDAGTVRAVGILRRAS